VINYCSRQIIVNEVVENFDPKSSANKTEPCGLMLRARTENIEGVPTFSKGWAYFPRVNYCQVYTSPPP
jgi:hypothetical protein